MGHFLHSIRLLGHAACGRGPGLAVAVEAGHEDFEGRLGETIAAWMRMRSSEGVPAIELPFDPRRRSSPPQRILSELTAYMRRASRAGALSVKSPRAAALAFLGALQAYAFMHRVAQISPVVPLDAYIETYLEVWKKGALGRGRRSR